MLWPCFAVNVVQHEHKLLDTKYKRKKIVELICMNYNAEKNNIILLYCWYCWLMKEYEVVNFYSYFIKS